MESLTTLEDQVNDLDPFEMKEHLKRLGQQGHWTIKGDELEFTQRIGAGGSAQVYKGIYRRHDGGRDNEVIVAIKVFKEFSKTKLKEEFAKEFQIMSYEFRHLSSLIIYRALRAKEIVHFFGVCFDYEICMVFEYCERDSLNHVMNDASVDFGWDKVLKFSFQMGRGLSVLHSAKPEPIVHRDVKSLNMLV
jgi:mitogen-activated protein kinase kinase kinase 10